MFKNMIQPGKFGQFKLNKWLPHLTVFNCALLAMGLLAFTGCSNNGGGNGPVNANPVGYYDESGTATVKMDDNTTDLVITDLQGMINGSEFKVMSFAEDLLYDGTITGINENNFTASVTIFRAGEIIGTATISGMITEGSAVSGTLTGTGAGNGTFNLVFALSNNQEAVLTNFQGVNWNSRLQSFFGNYEFSLNNSGEIDYGVAFITSIFNGCAVDMTAPTSPEFQVIAGTSLFQVNLTLASCVNPLVNGVYSGMASIVLSGSMSFMISNNTYAMYSLLDPG